MIQRLADFIGQALHRFQPRYPFVAGASILVLALVGGIFLRLLPPGSHAAVTGATHGMQHPRPSPGNDIHLIQMFDYDISISQITPQLARPVDLVWGADANAAKLRAWHQANPSIVLSSYLSFERDSQRHDLAYWKRTHPDWILYQCDKVTPAYLYRQPSVPLDFSNPIVVQWQLSTTVAQAEQLGYDALAVDDINLHNVGAACGHYQGTRWVPLYSGQSSDSHWSASVLFWLKAMQQQLHSLSRPLALISTLNLTGASSNDGDMASLLASVDGVVMADGFNSTSDRQDWVNYIDFMHYVQQQRKAIYVVNQFTPPPDQFALDNQQVQWALASYLMGEEGQAGLFIGKQEQFGEYLFYPSYSAAIGQPIGQMYRVAVSNGGTVYLRDFSQGESIVNPDPTHSYTVALPAGRLYQDLQGQTMSDTVTLPSLSGMVLLAQVQPASSLAGTGPIASMPTPIPTPTRRPPTSTPAPTLAPPTPTPTPTTGSWSMPDDFQRPDQSSWGMASGGDPWQIVEDSNTNFSIVNDTGQVTMSASGQGFGLLGANTPPNMEVIAWVTCNAMTVGQSNIGVVLRWTDSNDWYAMLLTGNTLQLVKDVQGTRSVLASRHFTLKLHAAYIFLFFMPGSQLYARIWQASASEPTGWQLTASDSSLSTGYGGVFMQGQAGTNVQVTAIRVEAY
jgi:hypothetical protein